MKRDLKRTRGNVGEESEGQKQDEMKTWKKKGKEDQQKDRKEKKERTQNAATGADRGREGMQRRIVEMLNAQRSKSLKYNVTQAEMGGKQLLKR